MPDGRARPVVHGRFVVVCAYDDAAMSCVVFVCGGVSLLCDRGLLWRVAVHCAACIFPSRRSLVCMSMCPPILCVPAA